MSHSDEVNPPADGPGPRVGRRPVGTRRGERARTDDLHRDGLGTLLLPILLGLSVAAVTYILLFGLVLWIALARFDYSQSFGTGNALVIGLQGAIALGLACALGSWLTGQRAQLRDVAPLLAHRAALLAGLILTALVLPLGIAPALRLVTVPIYLLAAILGTVLGSALGSRNRP